MVTFAEEEPNRGFILGREEGKGIQSAKKRTFFSSCAGHSIAQPLVGRALPGVKSPGQTPTCPLTVLFPSCPSISHSSLPFPQFSFPARPKLSIFGQLLSSFLMPSASVSEQECSAVLRHRGLLPTLAAKNQTRLHAMCSNSSFSKALLSWPN